LMIEGSPGMGKSHFAARLVEILKLSDGSSIFLNSCSNDVPRWDASGIASPIRRLPERGSQSLIVRTLGLLERKRQDLEEFFRSQRWGPQNLAVQRRLFGVEELPSRRQLILLKMILVGAIRSLAGRAIRNQARNNATLAMSLCVASTTGGLSRRLPECIYRTVPRTELIRPPTRESSANASHRPALLRHRQCNGTRRRLSHSIM
jgi:hypothetical protein